MLVQSRLPHFTLCPTDPTLKMAPGVSCGVGGSSPGSKGMDPYQPMER